MTPHLPYSLPGCIGITYVSHLSTLISHIDLFIPHQWVFHFFQSAIVRLSSRARNIWHTLLYNNVQESFDKRQVSSYTSTSHPSPTSRKICHTIPTMICLTREMISNLLFDFLCKVGRVRAVFQGCVSQYHTE